jgi:hypothetical protein
MLILGDSHALAIKAAASTCDVRLNGGRIDAGRFFNTDFHTRVGDDIFFNKEDYQKIFKNYLQENGAARISDVSVPILCTFGMNIHYLIRADVWGGFDIDSSSNGQRLSRAVVKATVGSMVAGSLQFYRDLVDLGCKVICPLPPRCGRVVGMRLIHTLFPAFEDILLELIGETGVSVIDHRSWSLNPDGFLKPEFRHPDPNDQVHGNSLFGKYLLDQIFRSSDAHTGTSMI